MTYLHIKTTSDLSKTKRFSLGFLACYAIVYLVTRLINLTLLPAHYDEMAQLQRLEKFVGEGDIFIGLSDNLKWFQLWVLAAFSWLPTNPLWAGRFSSVFVGLLGGIGVYVLALALYRRISIGVVASLFYLIVPFVFFYDRMIMPDGLLTTLGIWTMTFSLQAIRRTHMGWGVLAGITICIASLTKLSGMAYLVIPLAAFLLFRPAKLTAKTWILLIVMYIPALAGGFVLLLFLNDHNLLVYSTKISSEQVDYWQLWLTNSDLAVSWVTNLMTEPLIILAIISAVLTFIYRSGAGLYLLVIPLVIIVPFIAVSKTWYPRYLMPVVPSFLILDAWILDLLYQWLDKSSRIARWRWIVFIVLGLIFIFPALFIDFWLLAEPEQAPLHAEERRQYIEGWPNTYGLTEAADYVENLARQHQEIYLAVNTDSFIVKEGLKYYFEQPANVKVVVFDPFSGYALEDLDRWALEHPTFLILNSFHEKGIDDFWTNPQLFVQAEKLAGFDRPKEKTSIDVYQWHSIPAMAEQWAIGSGVEHPVVLSGFTQVPDSIGAAQFETLETNQGNADFAMIDAGTIASGVFVQNGDNWIRELPVDWALTQFVPGRWYLFRLINNAPPAYSAQSTLGDEIALAGLAGFDLVYPVEDPAVGQSILLTLRWQALATISEDYVVFAQLIGSDGRLYAQLDKSPLLPTTRWQPGQQLADRYIIPLDDNVTPGPYQLIVGMYNAASGERLPAYKNDGNRWVDDAVVLAEVTILPAK